MPALKIKVVNQVIAIESAKLHQENFRSRKWSDTGTRWKARKDNDTSRALLVKTGRLRKTATHARTKRDSVEFVMPLYGKVHNEGLKAGRGAGFFMPRRQFLGESRILKNRFNRKAKTIINRHLRSI
jgi:phage gpG-like protein